MNEKIDLDYLEAQRKKFSQVQRADHTQTAYEADWRYFSTWCEAVGRDSLPASPDTVALYVTYMLDKGLRVITAQRRMYSVAYAHRVAGYPSPVTDDARKVLRGARRLRKERPRQKVPLTVHDLHEISLALGNDPKSVRNRALLVLGFGSALRRSSISGLSLDDVHCMDDGVAIFLRSEKQDQEGKGRVIGVCRGEHAETCPVRTLKAWLEVRGGSPGPLFTVIEKNGKVTLRKMGNEAVNQIVKRAVALLGRDPREYGGHSLRAGLVTAAGEAGVQEFLIAKQTGHKNLEVLRRYFRSLNPFQGNATSRLGM